METNWKKQLVFVLLLIGLPLAMAYINGKEVYQSLVWEETPETGSENADKRAAGNPLRFGVFDPDRQFDNYNGLAIEVFYISWLNVDEGKLVKTLKTINSKGRTPFMVCEPWAKPGAPANYLDDVPKGAYDSSLNGILRALKQYGNDVYFSWGHEMDQDLTTRYSWSAKEPVAFINAFKYVRRYFNSEMQGKIQWVWSPIAKKGCLQYWPGDEYADIIGFPVYSFPEWDRSYYGFIRDFKTTFEEKYKLVKSLNKPIFIVEFGVTGSEDYATYWTQQAFREFNGFPLLNAICFFYAKDFPNAWGSNISTPDWRMNKELVKGLVDYYKN
jgi:beta-mannanase